MTGSRAGEDAATITERARILLQLNRYDEARLRAQDALTSDASFTAAHVIRAQALLLGGSAQGALEAVRTGLRHAPHEPALWRTKADALLACTPPAHEAAHDAAREAVRLAPEDVHNHLAVARSLMLGRDRAALRRTVARIGELSPYGWVRPLAEAMVHLQRVRPSPAALQLRMTPAATAMFTVAVAGTGGGVLLLYVLVFVIWWLAHVVQRYPHLVRADARLREALGHEPESTYLHLVRADVLRLRFRYRAWVRHETSAARLDIRSADAGRMVAGLQLAEGLTVTLAWGVALVVAWFSPSAGPGLAVVTVVFLAIGVAGFGLVVLPGTTAAPPAVRRSVERSPWTLISLLVGTWLTGAYLLDPALELPGRIAVVVQTLVLLTGLGWFVRRWRRGARA